MVVFEELEKSRSSLDDWRAMSDERACSTCSRRGRDMASSRCKIGLLSQPGLTERA